ncbi:MAG: hypothetical protein ABIU05_16740 [Nitrospirales bacterium]
MRDIEGIEDVVASLGPHWTEIHEHFERENDRFKKLMAQDHDILGRVLKCHLVIEHYLERFLSSHFGIEHLANAKLSFFQKATMLPDSGSAAAFVKPGILKLNTIRNQFGHTLRPVLRQSDLGPINEVLGVARKDVTFAEPIDAIHAFTTVASTFLIVPPPNLQKVFVEAFSKVKVNAL